MDTQKYTVEERRNAKVILPLLGPTKNVHMKFSVWPRGKLRKQLPPFSFRGT